MQACGLKLASTAAIVDFPASRLMQACGLKPFFSIFYVTMNQVTPHAGVWIETETLL